MCTCQSVWYVSVSVGGLCRFKNRSVLSYHYYCWLINSQTVGERYSLWQRVVCDDVLGPLVMTHQIYSCTTLY